MNVGQIAAASVFFRQHNRHHTIDDGAPIWVLDIWLFIQIDITLNNRDECTRPGYPFFAVRDTGCVTDDDNSFAPSILHAMWLWGATCAETPRVVAL